MVDSQLRYTRASLLVADSRVLLERMAVRLRELTVLLPYYGSAERANARFHKFSRAKGGQHRALARAFPEGEVVYFGDGYRGGARRKGDRVGTNVKVGDACCDFALIPFFDEVVQQSVLCMLCCCCCVAPVRVHAPVLAVATLLRVIPTASAARIL